MAILSLSSSIEAILATLLVFALVGLLLRWDYRRLCRRLAVEHHEEQGETSEDWLWPERNVGPPSRTHVGRKP